MADSSVKFDDNGDGIARYTIYNYQKDETGRSDYKVIGKWHSELMMDAKDVLWSFWDPTTTTVSPGMWPTTTLSPTLVAEDSEAADETTTLAALEPAMTTWPDAFASAELDNAIPQSVCSFPCKTGEIMIMNTVILFFYILVMD